MSKILLRWGRVISLLIVFTMLLGMAPLHLLRVYGAETLENEPDLENNDVFGALGFDTSQYPEGYDPESTDNPYGRDQFTANEVLEAFILGRDTYRLAGHNSSIKPENITSTGRKNGNFPTSGFRKLASGDFDGDGLAGEMVYVANSGEASSPGIAMYFIDASRECSKYGSKQIVAEGRVSTYRSGGFANIDWINILQIASGDFDGDGYSEIAVYVPEKGNARVDVYKYQRTSGSGSDGWTDFSKWQVVWSHALSSAQVAPNMVSLCAGDFNRDGIDDLAISYGLYVFQGGNAASRAVALFGSRTAMLQTNQPLPLGGDNMYRASLTYGDADGDGVKELVFGAQPFNDLSPNKKRCIGMYGYDGSSVVLLSSSVMEVVDGESVDGKWISNNGFDGNYYSNVSLACNVAVTAPFEGGGKYIYLDSVLYSYDSGALKIEYELDDDDINGDGVIDDKDNLGWNKDSDGRKLMYFEYGACSGDVSGSGAEAFISNYIIHHADLINSHEELRVLFGRDGKLVKNYLESNPNGEGRLFACLANTDKDDTVLMRYKGEHYIVHTDPKVLAVIASAPYFKDVAAAEDGYLDSLETSFGSTTGSGSSTITTVGFEVGGYYSYEGDFFEFEATAGFTFEWEREIAQSTEYTVSFNTPGGEDSVAFYSIPTEVYVYEMLVPDGKGGYTQTETTVKIPHTAAVQVLRMDYYTSIASDYKDELPEISGKVLTHTLGDPSSYPGSANDYLLVSQYNGDWAGLSYGQGSISQEISITREESNSYNFGASASVRFGGGAAGHKGGAYLNFNAGGGYSEVDIEGTSFGGTIKNMPVEMEHYGYYFAWKLFAYAYAMNKGKADAYYFPVISYLVKDVTAPPELPEDFAQNFDNTTDSQVELTWSYGGAASRFYIYRYFEFPEGGGSYLVGTVSASDYKIMYDSAGRPYKAYSFTDKNLSPYTEYQYQIQTERSKAPPLSGISGILKARTKASDGYPQLSITPEQLTVYPDRNEILMAEVANITDYTGNTAKYQWQKLTDGIWKDVEGAVNAALIFSKAGTGAAGYYRCRVNVITKSDNRAFSAYTNTAQVAYSKRSIILGPISAVDTLWGTTLSMTVSNAHPGSGSIPSGMVAFQIKSESGNAEYIYMAQVDPSGKAEIDIDSVPQGVYTISAYYSGSRIFKSGFAESIRYFSGIGSGYWLDAADTAVYGDTIPYRLYMMSRDGGDDAPETQEVPVSRYEIYEEDTPYTGNIYNGDEGTIYAGKAGSIILRAYYEDSLGAEKYIDAPITIQKRDITLKIPSGSGALNQAISGEDMKFTVLSGRIVGDYSDFARNISYTYRNTAGTAVDKVNVPKTPGYYTVFGSANAVLTSNYSIKFMDGSYIVTGEAYPMKASMRRFEGLHRGTLYMVSPNTASTVDDTLIESQVLSGTKMVFSAVPHSGYTVYDWYINGVAQGSKETYLACNMFAEETLVEVQFAVKQNTIIYGTAREGGGTVACINDASLESGSIVVQGTELKFKAVPDEGYHFSEWRYTAAGSGIVYSQGVLGSDGSSTYTMTMPSGSASLYGAFKRDSYKLEYSQGLTAVYMGDHDGDSDTPDREIEADSGTYVRGDTVITLMPRKGYRVDDTTAWLAIGSQGQASPDNGSYTLTLTEDTYVQMNVVRGEFKAYLGFEDKDLCKGSTISYRIGGGDAVTISGDSYTSPVELSIKGGESFYAEVSAEKDHEFIQWIYIQGGNHQENILTQGYGIDAVDDNFILSAVLKHKNMHNITLGPLTEPGASYNISLNGGNYEAASPGDAIPAVEGDSLSIRVILPAGKAVAYWNVDGQSTQSSSNTYTFENIVESHNITPVFTATTYLTVSWPQVSSVINGCTVIPEKGSLTMVSPGGEFKFKLSTKEGIEAEAVYANGALLTPVGGIYTISSITSHQVITVMLKDLGITVDGRDIKNLMGQGWKYDITEKRLNLLSNDLTLSGSLLSDKTNNFSVVIESGVSSVTFHNLKLESQNIESLITGRRAAGLTVTLRGENRAEIKQDLGARFSDQYVINAQRLIFSADSTGTLDVSIDYKDCDDKDHFAVNVYGIMAESLAVNGGTINIFSKNYMERSQHSDYNLIYGIKAAGTAGITVKGGTLNIEALANGNLQGSGVDGEQFPDTYGIYAEKGNMMVEGGNVSITANGSRGGISQYTNIVTSETYGIMLKNGSFKINGGTVSVDSSSKFSNPCGISAHKVDVEDGSLKIYAYSYPGLYYSKDTGGRGIILTKSGTEEGTLSNGGGQMELRTKIEDRNTGKNLTITDGSHWTLSSYMAVSAGANAMSAAVVEKSAYLASQTAYMKVEMSAPIPAGNVEIRVGGAEYESIYPDEGSTEQTGDGWKYEDNLLTLDGVGKEFEIKGTDTELTVFADYERSIPNFETVLIKLDNFHGKQLKLKGYSDAHYGTKITLKGENTLKNDVAYVSGDSNYTESPLYIESFTANIEGEGSLSVINKAEGFAMTSVSYNGDDRNFSQIITVKSGSFLLYGGRSAVFSRCESPGMGFYQPYDAIEVPDYNNVRTAEAGSSAEDAELLPAGYNGKFLIEFDIRYWEYEHSYLKIYDKHAKGSITPENQAFDKNGVDEAIEFTVKLPVIGESISGINRIDVDGTPIFIAAIPFVATGTAIKSTGNNSSILLELNKEYLKTLSTDTHRLTVEFSSKDSVYAFITVRDTTAPLPTADIAVTPETSTGYRGYSVRISAKLSNVKNIGNRALSWTLTGNLSPDTKLTPVPGINEAVLNIGVNEAAGGLNISARLTDYPQFESNTAVISVEVPAVKVDIEPENTELYYKIPGRNTQQFTAEVEGLGKEAVSQAVDWRLWGNTRLATKISSDGLLTVDYNETGWKGSLEVYAVSKAYPYVVSSRAYVTLLPDEKEPPETVTVMGTATSGGAIKSILAGYGTDLEDIDAVNKPAAVESGMKVVFTAEPDNPDTVCVWEVQGDDNYTISEDGTVLTINEIKSDVNVTVSFKPSLKFFDITVISGENYSISIASKTPDAGEPNEVREGGTVEFIVTPNEGYFLKDITASGGTVSKTYDMDGSGRVKVSNIDSEVSIEAVSEARLFYVSYAPVTGGRIIVKDSGGNIVAAENAVPYGTVLTISSEADSDYEPDGLTVNGKEFTSGSTYRVTGNVTITAAFKYVPKKEDPNEGGGSGGGGKNPPAENVNPPVENLPEQGTQPGIVVFDDVNDGDWYKEAVDFISARGIVLGIAPNLYGPGERLTRGQFIAMLMRAYDLGADADTEVTNNFADAGDTYYTPYLGLARALGLTEGIGNNLFAPEGYITRQDMAVMLYRILKKLDKLPVQTVEKSIYDFEDAEEIAPYALEALEALVRCGILSGYDNRIMPRDEFTRAQAAQVMYNILK